MNQTQSWDILPTHLTSRLIEIFSKEEMDALRDIYTRKKRLVTFSSYPNKISSQEITQRLQSSGIEFIKLDFLPDSYMLADGFQESDLWSLDMYKNGSIYLQSLASQIPVNLFTKNDGPLRILDSCAAPGGKTFQLAKKYPNAQIFAFEPNSIRFKKMMHNFGKLELPIISVNDAGAGIIPVHDTIQNIGNYINANSYFDYILVDAPCSGEGTLSFHSQKFLENWSVSHIKKNYARQKDIIDSVIPYLAIDGELIYSTCTIAPEENEAVVHYTLSKYPELGLENISLPETPYIQTKKALTSFGGHAFRKEIPRDTLRIIPNEFAEGFYIAKFKNLGIINS